MLNRKEFLKTVKVKSYMTPLLITYPTSGKRAAVFPGSIGIGFYLVDESVTQEDVLSVWEKHSFIKPNNFKEKFKTWKIKGSKGNHYNVTLKNDSLTCECKGFGFRRRCRHIDEVKKKLKNS